MSHDMPKTASEETPAHPHLVTEFFVWLWYTSEQLGGRFDLGDDLPQIDAWVEARLSFRSPDEDRPRAVLTGENPSSTLEAKAALAGGKVVRDLRIGLRREGREFSVSLQGAHLDLHGAKLPAELKTGRPDEVLYERMYLVEDLWYAIGLLYRRFAWERSSPEWASRILPAIRTWASVQPAT